MRAEALTGKMYATEESLYDTTTNTGPSTVSNTRGQYVPIDAVERPKKKPKFSYRDHVSSADVIFESIDKVTTYKSLSIRQIGLEQESFLSDPFSFVHFWYYRRK